LGQLVFTEEAVHGGKPLVRFCHEYIQRFIAVANLYTHTGVHVGVVLRLLEEIRYAAYIVDVGQ
jgi:hypothetical protein